MCINGTEYYFSSLDNVVCACDWCVLALKLSLLTLDPTLIKCVEINIVHSISVKIGVNVQEWFLFPRYQIISYMFTHMLDIHQNTAVCRTFFDWCIWPVAPSNP